MQTPYTRSNNLTNMIGKIKILLDINNVSSVPTNTVQAPALSDLYTNKSSGPAPYANKK
jgi:hypothetical protein